MEIGYIRRSYDENNKPSFKLVVSKVTKIVQTSKSKRVYSKGFYPQDYDDLVSTTEMIDPANGLIIVCEPFLLDEKLKDYLQKVVDEWNVNPPKSIFD